MNSPLARTPLRYLGLILFTAVTIAFSRSPMAELPAPEKPLPSKAEVARMIDTIEDAKAREKLVEQLKTLAAADQAERNVEQPGLLQLLSEEMQQSSDELLAVLTATPDLGQPRKWVTLLASDDQVRSRWAIVFGKLTAVLAGGVLAERLLVLMMAAPRRIIAGRRSSYRWMRLPLTLFRWLFDLPPIVACVAVVYALLALPLFKLTEGASVAATLLIGAYAWVRALLSLTAVLLAPGAADNRLLPLDDETANYLAIWARRLSVTGVWGYFIIRAFEMLGLSPTATHFLMKLLGLFVSTLLVILVLQNRQSVADAIRSRGDAGAIHGLRNRLADVWHVLACLYVVASFCIWALQVKGGFAFVVTASLWSIAILVAANAVRGALAKLVERAFSISDDLRHRLPGLESRANRYLTVMDAVLRGLVSVVTLLACAQAWGGHTLAWLGSELGRRLIAGTLSIGAVVMGAVILWELVSGSVERYLSKTDADGRALERSARARTLLPLLRNFVLVVLIALVSLILLSQLGVDIAPLLAGAGVVGVAIGFGSQKLVQDVITGAFMLFEDTLAVGDQVKIGDHTGTVEGLTIRTLRLRDVNGHMHTLPFSSVATVINMSRDFGYSVFEISVTLREDADLVMATIRQVGDDLRDDDRFCRLVPEPIEIFGIDKLGNGAMVISGRLKTPPGKQSEVGHEFNRRLKRRFDEAGIQLSYPSSTIFLGGGKDAGLAVDARGLPKDTIGDKREET